MDWGRSNGVVLPSSETSVVGEYIDFPAKQFLEYAILEKEYDVLYIMIYKVTQSNSEHIGIYKMDPNDDSQPKSGLYIQKS